MDFHLRVAVQSPHRARLRGASAMFDAVGFRDAVRRVRAGDELAAAELVQKYEPLIRREVRLHLDDSHLRRMFDSMDIAQSVLASFFVRAAAGEYDLDDPAQLAALLVKMTRNKLASAARKHYRSCRDMRKTGHDEDVLRSIPSADRHQSAEEEIANAELLQCLREELTAEERQIAALRADGRSWHEVAAALGGSAQSRRMQLTRGVERAARKTKIAVLYD